MRAVMMVIQQCCWVQQNTLAETRNFDGSVAVIFQPAEEGGAGGKAMVEDGMMDRFNIKEVYGLHNMPGLDVGEFAIRPGPIMAATDEFKITITGKGAHAAMPQEGIDPVTTAAQIVMGLQTIVSRNLDPFEPLGDISHQDQRWNRIQCYS